jgi:hypothetical protein
MERMETIVLPGEHVFSFHETSVVVEHLGIPVAILEAPAMKAKCSDTETL